MRLNDLYCQHGAPIEIQMMFELTRSFLNDHNNIKTHNIHKLSAVL